MRGGEGEGRVRDRRATLFHQAGGGGASGRSRGLPAAHWYSPTATHRERERVTRQGRGVAGRTAGLNGQNKNSGGGRLEEEVRN